MPAAGLALAGQDLGQSGLAGAVAADQADLVAGGDPEGRVLEQDARPGAELDVGGGDHGGASVGAAGRVSGRVGHPSGATV